MKVTLTKRQQEVLSLAAELSHRSLSQFIVEKAYVAAQETLGKQRHFTMTDQQWNWFCEALDVPACPVEKLRELLKETAVI
jgi:uncharacterized protein (DUF1778 family)